MAESKDEFLGRMARRYAWWKTPTETLAAPDRLIAQVMDIGDFDDVRTLIGLVGEEALRHSLANAEAGQFSPRSWAYWHYRLGLADLDTMPAMPLRNLG